MSLSVEGQKCPVCDGYLFDDDDLVFCPECGAPHHRDCYASKGSCGLSHLHGTDSQYTRPEVETETPKSFEDNKASQNTNTISGNEIKIKTVCPNCKTVVENGEEVCPNCKNPMPVVFSPFGAPLPVDPLGGVPDAARLEDGISPKEVALYTAVNTPRYVRKFFCLDKKNKASWNWAAFLFPNAWFFYRKIYFPGIAFFLLTALSGVMAMAINFAFGGMTFKDTNEMTNYLLQNIDKISPTPLLIASLGSILNIVVRVLAGIFGDFIYRQDAKERINKAKEETESELTEAERIRKKGGINPFLGLLGIVALSWVQYLIFGIL